MANCPFCEITKENRILKEGKLSCVFLSNPRVMPGHVLVTPKRHITKISELTKGEWEEISNFLVEFQTKILQKIASGCEIRQNFKPFLKESRTHVSHVHFHLLPREENDELYGVEKGRTDLFLDLTDVEKEKLTKLLK